MLHPRGNGRRKKKKKEKKKKEKEKKEKEKKMKMNLIMMMTMMMMMMMMVLVINSGKPAGPGLVAREVLASEGKALPVEMRGPRLMQQLRERADKIVQHLTAEQVSTQQGLQLIKDTMERSPIIKLLDQKNIDQRRQKFMRLARLHQKSIESFLNSAKIYRKENETSPAYQVGSKFYVGHLLDAAKLS